MILKPADVRLRYDLKEIRRIAWKTKRLTASYEVLKQKNLTQQGAGN